MAATSSHDLVAAARVGSAAFREAAKVLAADLEQARRAGGCSEAGQVAAALRATIARVEAETASSPRWYFSARAVREWAELISRPAESDADFADREEELMAAAASARLQREQENGLELWRMGRPYQFRLMVSKAKRAEGELPQLVSVLPSSPRGGGVGRSRS